MIATMRSSEEELRQRQATGDGEDDQDQDDEPQHGEGPFGVGDGRAADVRFSFPPPTRAWCRQNTPTPVDSGVSVSVPASRRLGTGLGGDTLEGLNQPIGVHMPRKTANTPRRRLKLLAIPIAVASVIVVVAAGLVTGPGQAASAAVPNNTAPPTISGSTNEGQTLTAVQGHVDRHASRSRTPTSGDAVTATAAAAATSAARGRARTR